VRQLHHGEVVHREDTRVDHACEDDKTTTPPLNLARRPLQHTIRREAPLAGAASGGHSHLLCSAGACPWPA
jgi:hypothetical protein